MKPITTAIVSVIVLVALALIGLTFAQTAHGAFIVKPAGGYNAGPVSVPQTDQSDEIATSTATTARFERNRTARVDDDAIEEARIEELQKIVVKLTALLNELLAQKSR